MIKYFFLLIFCCESLIGCSQHAGQIVSGLTIDPSIRYEVEKQIDDSASFGTFDDIIPMYRSNLYIELFEDDSLLFSTMDSTFLTDFRSYYLWIGDTLIIDGAFGWFTGIGFTMRIIHDSAYLYNLLSADDLPALAYTNESPLLLRLEVPCHRTKMILSALPDSINNNIIYGYVEFESAEYYSGGSTIKGIEIEQRKKARSNMKIYFKSKRLEF